MTSASTKRRRKRDAALFSEWVGTPIGQRVTVTRANGETLKTITESGPMMVDNKHAMIRVEGIPGNTRLERVRKGWNPEARLRLGAEVMREMMKPPGQEDYAAAYRRASGRATADKDAEIERLRAAMVHAMDDCEAALVLGVNGRALTRVVAARTALKTALEKK